MKIVVCMKQVPDTEARIRVAPDAKSIETRELKYVMNPYDEFAVEEALRLREAHGGTVTIVCVGPDRSRLAIRDALAMGADDGILVKDQREHRDDWSTARILAEVLKEIGGDLILFGKQAVDVETAQVPSRVAEILDLPCVTMIAHLELQDGRMLVRRDVDGGVETVECPLPAVVSADKSLNEPRYASLKGIMGAKKKPIVERAPGDFPDKVRILGFRPAPERKGGKIVGTGVEAVPELVRLLKEEAKVL